MFLLSGLRIEDAVWNCAVWAMAVNSTEWIDACLEVEREWELKTFVW